jgi:SAM-dependent methyltransferase
MIYEMKNLTPQWLEPMLIRWWYLLRPWIRECFGGEQHYCPICESRLRLFLPHKWRGRHLRVVCPVCLSHPRHRQAWLFLKQQTNLFDASPKRLLHFAPETIFIDKFRRVAGVEYLSTDLESPHAMARMDITALDCEAELFDAVYCSHVLEHVPDDRKAMSEIHRVLRPGGWALIQVPLSSDVTKEDLSITDPRERLRLYGQRDHVRFYGLDIGDRLESAGFAVQTVKGADLASDEECKRFGFSPAIVLFFCKKAQP